MDAAAQAAAALEARQSQRRDYLLAAGAVLAWVLFSFRSAVEDQLSRLHAPGTKAYGYKALHGGDLHEAIDAWTRGRLALEDFEPVTHRSLILQHTSIAVALAVLLTVVLVVVLRRAGTPRWALVFPAVYGLSSVAGGLLDLAIADDQIDTERSYTAFFRILDPLPYVCLGAVAVVLGWQLVGAWRAPWRSYRAAPASVRLSLWLAVVFFAICNLGDIGAQLDDLLRRTLTLGSGWGQTGQLGLLAGAIATYLVVLRCLNELHYDVGEETSGTGLLRFGLVAAVAGSGAVALGGQSALLVGGVVLLLLGVVSWQWQGRPEFPRRVQLEIRLAGALLAVGAALAVLGLRMGTDAHVAITVAGAILLAMGAVIVALRWWSISRGAETGDFPAGPDAAALVALAGLGVMVAVRDSELARTAGAALAGVSTVVLLVTRRWFTERAPVVDPLAIVAIAGGIVGAHVDHDHPWALLAVAGLAALLLNRRSYVPVPWGPSVPPALAADTPDADGTGILVVAGALPLAGLLTLSVRALGGELARGASPPFALLAFQVLVLALEVAGALLISRSAGQGTRPRRPVDQWPGRVVSAVLVVVAVTGPVLALLSLWSRRSVAQEVGELVEPLPLLIGLLAALAAIGGLVRILTRKRDRPAVVRRLGLRRTPVNGLVVTWLLLVMVVGSSLELPSATSHDVRIRDVPEAVLAQAEQCDRPEILEAVTRGGGAAEGEVAMALCRWADAGLDQGRTDLPLVLVTASGGGVRAAAWTSRVLDCLLMPGRPPGQDDQQRSEPCDFGNDTVGRKDRWSAVFAIGGASGGSVGAATAVAERIAPLEKVDVGWAHDIAERDHLAPVAGQMVIAELGLQALGLVPGQDRAEVLYDEWSRLFGPINPAACPGTDAPTIEELGFLEARAACPGQVPLLLFNGTVVRTGTRFNISPLGLPDAERTGSVNLRDALCPAAPGGTGQDVPFFDAAFLSGRFPLVTPSGRLGYDDPPCDLASPVDVVDGGYHENSGILQVDELWDRLRPLVSAYNAGRGQVSASLPELRPILLRIVNGRVSPEVPLSCGIEGGPLEYPDYSRPQDSVDQPTVETMRDRDLAVRFGEPLRIPWTVYQSRVRGDVEDDEDLERARLARLCETLPSVVLALYDYPGRSLPLGWSLTSGILDDLEKVMALEQNACRARAFVDFVDSPGAVVECAKELLPLPPERDERCSRDDTAKEEDGCGDH